MATIQFSGLGSGLTYTDWISALVDAKKAPITTLSTKVSTITDAKTDTTTLKGYYSTLSSSLTKLTDSNLSSSWDLFSKTSATSSNTDTLTVTNSGNANIQSLKISISQLATNTTATSTSAVSSYIDEDTKFSTIKNGEGTTGSFTFYVDNAKYSVNVEKDDTLGDIMDKIKQATVSDENPDGLVSASINNGKLTLDAGSSTLTLGSSKDESNLVSILGLKKNTAGTSYESGNALYDLNTKATLTGSDSGLSTPVTEGTFKIGGKEFKVDSSTTLASLISKINSSDAGATASFDEKTGKLTLTSEDTGAFNISVEDGTSNFLSVFGLTSDGKIASGSQTLGDNAIMTINGTTYESFSNTVGSDTTGLSGLVFNLKEVTETDSNVKVNVSQDSSQLLSAVKSMISAYNAALSNTDKLQAASYDKEGNYEYNLFQYDTSLSSIRRSLRQEASYFNDSDIYSSLSTIGISTGAAGQDAKSTSTSLVLDETKFLAALKEDPESVRKLLIGDGSEDSDGGFAGKLKKVVENSLSTDGYFSSKTEVFDSQVKRYNSIIEKKTRSLELYEKVITAQFQAMDNTIATLKSQYSNFTSSSSS